MLKMVCLLVLLWAALPAWAQYYDPKDFVAARAPELNSPDQLQLSKDSGCKVQIVDGRLRVSVDTPTTTTAYAIGRDSLYAADYGNWGGALFYKPADTVRRHFFINGEPCPGDMHYSLATRFPKKNPLSKWPKDYCLVINGNIRRLFRYKDSLYYTVGYTTIPGQGGDGSIHSIDLRGNRFTLDLVRTLHDNPMAVMANGDRLWIATDNGVLLRYEHGEMTAVLVGMCWAGFLSANSIAVGPDGIVYVGFRGGYMAVDPEKGTYQFFRHVKGA